MNREDAWSEWLVEGANRQNTVQAMWLLSDKIVSRVKAIVTLDVERLGEGERIPGSKGSRVDTDESSVAMSDEVRPPPLEWILLVQQRSEVA